MPDDRTFTLRQEHIDESIARWRGSFERVLEALDPDTPLLADTKKHLEKRWPPRLLQENLNVFGAIRILFFDMASLGSRILQYQNIGLYPNTFMAPSPEVGGSFVMHMWNLRISELYVILERGSDFLRFCFALAQNVGLESENQADKYARRFRKKFETRLRDRHRIVHSHERPSLMSRIFDFVANEKDKQILTDEMAHVTVNMVEILAYLDGQAELDETSFKTYLEKIRSKDRILFGQESLFVWNILGSCFEETFYSATHKGRI